MRISEIVQSSGWKGFMAKLYGLGASVVITGALFKIQHWSGAGIMLTLGLCTEAIIFFFSAFEPLHEELDWTLVYPELAGMTDPDEIDTMDEETAIGRDTSNLEKFEEIMKRANIDTDTFVRLGEGLHQLNQAAMNISDISEASVATQNYISSIKSASDSIENMSNTYHESSDNLKESVDSLSSSYKETAEKIHETGSKVVEKFNRSGDELVVSYNQLAEAMKSDYDAISGGNRDYGEQLETINKNLTALNNVYELELQNTNKHLSESKEVFKDLDLIVENLSKSAQETENYTKEITQLRQNLSDLNTIYGNMLSAMNISTK